jgi:hypothetical protein
MCKNKYFFSKITYINLACDIIRFTSFRLAEKYGLQLVAKERFDGYYEKVREEGRSLLGKMQALEVNMHNNFILYSRLQYHISILRPVNMKMYIGFIWHRIGISDRLL